MKIDEGDVCVKIENQKSWKTIEHHLLKLGYKWEYEPYGGKYPLANGKRSYPTSRLIGEFWIFLNKSKKEMAPLHSIIPLNWKVVSTDDILTWGVLTKEEIRNKKINIITEK